MICSSQKPYEVGMLFPHFKGEKTEAHLQLPKVTQLKLAFNSISVTLKAAPVLLNCYFSFLSTLETCMTETLGKHLFSLKSSFKLVCQIVIVLAF